MWADLDVGIQLRKRGLDVSFRELDRRIYLRSHLLLHLWGEGEGGSEGGREEGWEGEKEAMGGGGSRE